MRHAMIRVASFVTCVVALLAQTPHVEAEQEANARQELRSPTKVNANVDNGVPSIAISRDGAGGLLAFPTTASASDRTCRPHAQEGVNAPNPGSEIVTNPRAGEFYWLICTDPDGSLASADIIQFTPEDPAIALRREVERAARNIPLPNPEIATSPPTDKPQLVGLKTWYWLTSDVGDKRAEVAIPGATATIVATFDMVVWTPGDDRDGVSCSRREVTKVYDPRKPDEDTHCGHVYINHSTVDSPDGTFELTAQVRYNVSWTASNGDGDILPQLTRTSSTPLLVHEIQAVITDAH